MITMEPKHTRFVGHLHGADIFETDVPPCYVGLPMTTEMIEMWLDGMATASGSGRPTAIMLTQDQVKDLRADSVRRYGRDISPAEGGN